jgi:hypothetical protein
LTAVNHVTKGDATMRRKTSVWRKNRTPH